MTRWPDEVPILTGRDICKGRHTSKTGKTHSLDGWLGVTFRTTRSYCRAAKAIEDQIAEPIPISLFSDLNSRAKSAKIWNRAMARLGYTEGNPEAEQ